MFLFGPPNVEKMKARRDVNGLIKALSYKNGDVHRAAIQALKEIGAPAVTPLIAALKDEKSYVRAAAAWALGEIKDPRAVEPLIAALRDGDGFMRGTAIPALGEIGAPAVEPLIAALQDKNKEVRWTAAQVLGRIGDARAVEPLIAALKEECNDVRWNAARALGQIGDARAVQPLTAALKDEWPLVRQTAAEALGQIGDPRAVEPLTAVLQDEESQVRQAAAEALDRLGWEPGPAETAGWYWMAKRDWDKCVAWGALGVELLIAALKDRNSEVRRDAIQALGEIGAPAVTPLIAALKDKREYVRQAAAEALGRIGDARAVEPLSAALKDVPYAAAQALDCLGWKPGQDENAGWYWMAKHDWKKCVTLGALAVEPLIAALKDEDWNVRRAAARALVSIYQKGELPQNVREAILRHRESITEAHDDVRVESAAWGCSHTDRGIGVKFPL